MITKDYENKMQLYVGSKYANLTYRPKELIIVERTQQNEKKSKMALKLILSANKH